MKSHIALLSIFFVMLLFGSSKATANENDWVAAASGLLQRLVPGHASQFVLSIIPQNGVSGGGNTALQNATAEADFFVVRAANGTVFVNASSGVALTNGIYRYLKHGAGCQVTWGVNGSGSQLTLPTPLPDYAQERVNLTVPIRYSWNMCTFSYSAAFWNESRWMEEIDWLALHGINFPLAFTGQEYVWWKLFQTYNVTLEELQPWFTGPAFLAWQRAGNIQTFAGPLTQHFIEGQMELQLKILQRMRSFGMKPILPCFAGHLPQVSMRVWPNATLTNSSAWESPIAWPSRLTHVVYLDPADPLFATIGSKFLEIQESIYGSDHFYNCDTFNEVDPTSTNLTYLKAAGRAVHTAISAQDPGGVWVMQAWLFHFGYWNQERVQAYLSGVPNASMLILDLNSEDGPLAPQFNQYYGKPWVWNLLHNYGGVRGMYGNLTEVSVGPFNSLAEPGNTMVGIGFTPEAIEQNPIMYEMLTDTFWGQSTTSNVSRWLTQYITQRYGGVAAAAALSNAWQSLFWAVYDQPGEPRTEIEWEPNWINCSSSMWGNSNVYGWEHGDPTLMLQAAKEFVKAVSTMPTTSITGPLLYDLVDIVRQATTMYFSDVHRQLTNQAIQQFQGEVPPSLMSSYHVGNNNTVPYNVTPSVQRISATMKKIIGTLDTLLLSNDNYQLGSWVESARSWSNGTAADTTNMMYNAKNQISLWGPLGQISDYAAKAWGGLYGDYYFARWSLMLDRLVEALGAGSTTWDQPGYAAAVLNLELAWDSGLIDYTPSATDSTVTLSAALELMTVITGGASTVSLRYTQFENMDMPNCDYAITPTWTVDVEALSTLCDLMDDCAGFNTNGYLKRSQSPMCNTTSFAGVNFFVKNPTPAPTMPTRPPTPIPTWSPEENNNNVTIEFTCDANVTSDALISTIRTTVPGAADALIFAVGESLQSGLTPSQMNQLAEVLHRSSTDLILLGDSTRNITLVFVNAIEVATTAAVYANNHQLAGVVSAAIVSMPSTPTPALPSSGDDTTKVILGVCIGVGGALLLSAMFYVIHKKREATAEGEYIPMNQRVDGSGTV